MYRMIKNKAYRNLILAKRPYESYRVSIPKDWVKKLGWKPRDELELRLVDNKIIIKKKEVKYER